MIIGHPGTWQQFQFRPDNKGLNVMEMKSKYLHEQYLFEAQMLNLQQIQQQNMFMNGTGGGGPLPSSEPTPPPPAYTTELRLSFNSNLTAVQVDFSADPSLLATWNARFPNANFETISIDQTTPSSPTITLKGNAENVGQVYDRAFADKTTIASLTDVNANCIIETAGTESFSNSSIVEVDLGAITTIDSVAFNQCTSLSTVLMPNLTTFVGAGTNLASAFYSCTSLSVVDFSSLERIPNYVFWNCTGLTDLTGFPSLSEVGQYSFAFSGLGDVTADRLTIINRYAFYRAQGIRSINLTTADPILIDKNAFEKCFGLNSITTVGYCTLEGTDTFLDVDTNGTYDFQGGYIDNGLNIPYLTSIGWTPA